MSAALPREIMLAGLPVQHEDAFTLVRLLGQAGELDTAAQIAGALTENAPDVALSIEDREAILAVLVTCQKGLLDLRATLLQEAAWRHREGL